jgi:preprotein translocase subunit SecD
VRRYVPILILVIGLFAAYIDLWPNSSFVLLTDTEAGFQTLETKLGLDLKGGFEIRYTAQPIVKANGDVIYPTSDQMARIKDIMESRVNASGVAEPVVELAGKYDVVVQVPGAKDPTAVAKLVGQTGQLDFVLLPRQTYGYFDPATNQYVPATGDGARVKPGEGDPIDATLPADFTGAQLDTGKISSGLNDDGEWVVRFAFQGEDGKRMATWSGQHVNDYFAIVLDGTVVSAPYIRGEITGGSGEISGSFNAKSAKELATILQYGALPFRVDEAGHRAISPTQAAFSFNQTLLAGAIGIGLVLLFMLIYYRLPGVIANMALAYYGLTVLAIFRIVPVTLTLAGIAGFVLSVGMAVDANILIFERTKEELRTGKTLVAAVEAGFNRAWNSILDSNVASLITAFVLYMGGSPSVKGFALVLIIGVATSMFTAVTVSRTLLRFVVHEEFAQRAWLFGVTDEEFQARAAYGRQGRREARGRV